jgi:hypothetical protein
MVVSSKGYYSIVFDGSTYTVLYKGSIIVSGKYRYRDVASYCL